MQDGGAQAVKLEGGEHVLPQVMRIVESGIPVMGHLGLGRHGVNPLGGLRRVQGRGVAGDRLLEDVATGRYPSVEHSYG